MWCCKNQCSKSWPILNRVSGGGVTNPDPSKRISLVDKHKKGERKSTSTFRVKVYLTKDGKGHNKSRKKKKKIQKRGEMLGNGGYW